MPKIVIKEIDASTPGSADITSNAVYIPGLMGQRAVDASNNIIERSDKWAHTDFTKPIYFENLSDFLDCIGAKAYQFKTAVNYADIGFTAADDLVALKNILSEDQYNELVQMLGLSEGQEADVIPFIAAYQSDKSYIMAVELLSQGLPIYYHVAGVDSQGNSTSTENADAYNAKAVYDLIEKVIALQEEGPDANPYLDRGYYILRFFTTGGYPVYAASTLAKRICKFAKARTDIVALIDYFDFFELLENGTDILFSTLTAEGGTIDTVSQTGEESSEGSYGAMFAPYATYQPTFAKFDKDADGASTTVKLPASFGYLMAYAQSIRNYPIYYAAAGVSRGVIPDYFATATRITNAQADYYQPRNGAASINAITEVRPYGIRVWGNRTLKDNVNNKELTATSFLNVRLLANEVKRHLYAAARRYTFEQNSDVLWINFKSAVIPILEAMIQNNGITGYRFVRLRTDKKATLKARLYIECVEAVEDFDLTVVLQDAVLNVDEEV